MQITLNGHVYRSARDSDGNRVVLVETGPRTSRLVNPELADPETTQKVLAGFLLAPLRMPA